MVVAVELHLFGCNAHTSMHVSDRGELSEVSSETFGLSNDKSVIVSYTQVFWTILLTLKSQEAACVMEEQNIKI